MHDQARSEHGSSQLAAYIAELVEQRMTEPAGDLLLGAGRRAPARSRGLHQG